MLVDKPSAVTCCSYVSVNIYSKLSMHVLCLQVALLGLRSIRVRKPLGLHTLRRYGWGGGRVRLGARGGGVPIMII